MCTNTIIFILFFFILIKNFWVHSRETVVVMILGSFFLWAPCDERKCQVLPRGAELLFVTSSTPIQTPLYHIAQSHSGRQDSSPGVVGFVKVIHVYDDFFWWTSSTQECKGMEIYFYNTFTRPVYLDVWMSQKVNEKKKKKLNQFKSIQQYILTIWWTSLPLKKSTEANHMAKLITE